MWYSKQTLEGLRRSCTLRSVKGNRALSCVTLTQFCVIDLANFVFTQSVSFPQTNTRHRGVAVIVGYVFVECAYESTALYTIRPRMTLHQFAFHDALMTGGDRLIFDSSVKPSDNEILLFWAHKICLFHCCSSTIPLFLLVA